MATMDADRVFVDSNVLLSATDRARATHTESQEFLAACVRGNLRGFACGQVFREYALVATRPVEVNGLGVPAGQAASNIRSFLQAVQVLEETAESLQELLRLVDAHDLKGKRIHDANLVAVMRSHGLRAIKTWNPGDFHCFEGVDCI
jgi:predicted nucleic acid-binding protein